MESSERAECNRRDELTGERCGKPAVGTLLMIGAALLDYCAEHLAALDHGTVRPTPASAALGEVLVLVEQPLLAEMISLTLSHGVFVHQVHHTAPRAMKALDTWQPQLAVIDMDLAGASLVPSLVAASVPILALTRRGDLRTKLRAVDQGARDFLTVPFSPEELLARALIVTRRTGSQHVPLLSAIKLGEIELDILQRVVRTEGAELPLTGLELSLLYLLVANAGRVVSRDEILDTIWGVDYIEEPQLVERHIHVLRAKLQDVARKPRFIATVRNEGYCYLPLGVGTDRES